MKQNKSKEFQLERILDMLTEFSKGNFEIRQTLSDDDTDFNSILSGLNMLGEELAYYRKKSSEQHYFLQKILSSVNEVVYARTFFSGNVILSPFTFVSQRSDKIIGCSVEELYENPENWFSALHPDDTTGYIQTLNALSYGKEVLCTYRVFNKRIGKYCWIEDRMVSESSTGTVTVYGAARDITEKQKITIELEDKNKLISQLITSSDQVFYIIEIDPENSFKNKCSFLSWQIEKIIGSTVQEVKDSPFLWLNSVHPDDLAQVIEVNREMFSSKQPVTRVYRIKHAHTNEYIWIEDYIVPILDSTDRIKEFYGSARDVTARKNAEIEKENLIQELSKRHEELMQFNHIISHNLRSPLATILGLSKLLQDIPRQDFETTSAYILQAAEALDEVLHDVNKILSYRTILNDQKETFSLSALIRLVRINLKNEIIENDAIINIHIAPDADVITSIKSYLYSALYNLVSNSIKFKSSERSLVITISAQYVNKHLVIFVKDNGIGIDLDMHGHRLFMLYSKINIEKDGKGLGLYMSKVQIEALNGKLTVDSEKGKGCVFSIIL